MCEAAITPLRLTRRTHFGHVWRPCTVSPHDQWPRPGDELGDNDVRAVASARGATCTTLTSYVPLERRQRRNTQPYSGCTMGVVSVR
jgi:hypothetical protein